MIELIYCSAATEPLDPEALSALLQGSRERNEARGLSGLLLYVEGSFLQVLEGPESAVDALYRKLEADTRHTGLQVLSRREIDERSFGDWRMGCVSVDVSELERLDGFSEFLVDGKLEIGDDADRVRRVLDGFREGRYRRLVDDDR